jgi:PRC-barrel domain protein
MRRPWLAAMILLAGWAASAAAQNASTPAAPVTPPPSAPAASPAPAANLETLAAPDARSVLGKKVSGAAGEDMGLVVDLLFDANKEPRAVVIDFGGFLGVGTRKIAVDWRLLQFYAPDSKTPLKLDLTRADVQSAPEYKPDDKTISVIGGPGRVAPVATPPKATPSEATPPAATGPVSPAATADKH